MRDSGPVLLPLDGSDLSAGALPYAEALARVTRAKLIVLTVWEGIDNELGSTFPSMALDVQEKAQAHFEEYLATAQANISGVEVETLVRTGRPADEIAKVAEDAGARLIVLATHGRSGLSRWAYGSTAGHVLRNGAVPVLAVGPHALEKPEQDKTIRHIMCPLDGSDHSAAALPVATGLARQLGARISLVRIVRWAAQAYPYTLPDAYVPQVDDELEEGAKAYLRKMEERIEGVERSAFVVRGSVAEGLFEFIDKEAVDLVVMTTHARSGIARMTLGSVAERLLHGTAPVLMIPPAE